VELGGGLRVGEPGTELRAQLGHRAVEARGAQHVVQPVPLRRGVVHVVGRNEGQSHRAGGADQLCVQPRVVRQPVALQLDPGAVAAEDVGQPAGRGLCKARPILRGQQRGRHCALAAAGEAQQPIRMARDVVDGQPRRPLGARELAHADQPAEVAVARLVFGQEEQVRAVGQGEFRADDGMQPGRPRRAPEGHGPVQPVVVRRGQGRHAERDGPRDQRLGRRRAVEQRVMGVAVQLAVHDD